MLKKIILLTMSFLFLLAFIGSNSSAQAINLMTNPSFEDIDSDSKPVNWTTGGFESDTSVARTDNASFRITDAHLIPLFNNL